MPEGHTLHRLAREHTGLFVGQRLRVTSPQGRFAEGAALLDGRRLVRVEAHGKHLLHHFEGARILHIHLGLYGKLLAGAAPAPEPVGQVRVRLEGETAYADLRGATACEVWTTGDRTELLTRLGPDPLKKSADAQLAFARIARSGVAIGQLLMDQSVLAGVGNVYRAEILFRHRLDPFAPGRELQAEQWLAVWLDLVTLMKHGLRVGRIITTEREHRAKRTGTARPEDAHYVYKRTGLPCRVCGTAVQTRDMAGRHLYWCPRCQSAG